MPGQPLGDLRFAQLPRSVRILQVVRETRTVSTFVLDATLHAEPGQFVMVWVPGVDEKPISIAWPDPLTLTIARVGEWSTAMHEKKAGDTIGIRGPYGRPYRIDVNRPALLVGGGYGAAPLYYLASCMNERGMSVTAALGARRADDLIFVDRFKQSGIEVLLATEDGSVGMEGYVTLAVEAYLAGQPSNRPTDPPAIYACGPEGLLVALHGISRRHGLPAQLSVERYMKCGFGVCGQCALDDILTCVDGPVLDAKQLDGKQDFGKYHRTATGRRLPV
ncbi:MAG TPA: dihydroorotate dehydrogenase electron transfer subunit [Anaerolineae bacterium]